MLLLQAAHMYLVSNVITDVNKYSYVHIMKTFFYNKAELLDHDHANENLGDLIDIVNQACELSIFDEIADVGSASVANQLPEIVERDLLNKFSDKSIKCIAKAFDSGDGVDWEGDAIAALDLVSDIQRNNYNAPNFLQTCLNSFLGMEIKRNWTTKDSWIKDIKGNENVDWNRPKWKKFIQMLKKMSWKKLCEEGRGFLKIVEHLDEYNEGGREEDWDALYGRNGITAIKVYINQTNWSLWEQENNKVDIYSKLLKFALEHDLYYMIDHCMIRLSRKILTWSSNDSMDAFADLQRRAEDLEHFDYLVKLAEEVMSRRKN